MIRFHALPFDSMRFDSILCEDFIIFSKTKKKAGISNGHFKLMNDDFVVSHVPRPVSHRSRASIAPFQGQDRTFRAILAQDRTVPGLERAILKERGTGGLFGGQERVTVRSVPEKISGTRSDPVPQNQERVPERG